MSKGVYIGGKISWKDFIEYLSKRDFKKVRNKYNDRINYLQTTVIKKKN